MGSAHVNVEHLFAASNPRLRNDSALDKIDPSQPRYRLSKVREVWPRRLEGHG
jgi:hypothetical protein